MERRRRRKKKYDVPSEKVVVYEVNSKVEARLESELVEKIICPMED